ncbi:MAG: signal peptidase I [Zoogloeaceae bacterium]|nr:signal peptidase I [Zoogloeaceae bacterium]
MNFALILFLLTAATGAVWLFDVAVMRKRRAPDAPQPWWVAYGADLFPIILLVFLLRSFLVEPFRIPSGSMMPTLLEGDFILVNKYTYGIRLPVINKKVLEIGSPRRGDVMVFRYPVDPSLDYIKRVIGLPGDKVAWQDKRLYINGQEAPLVSQPDYLHANLHYSSQYEETLDGAGHKLLVDRDAPSFITQVMDFPGRDKCIYNSAGVICEVPQGHYFVMGDNRDNSQDSRFWGFVPEENIVGRAFMIWLNFSDLKRIGGFH